MDAVRLGHCGLKVSPLSLGTMMFGGPTDLDTARSIADLCLERGVFSWDTADMYSSGGSEEVLGALLAGRRERVVLATKAWAPMGPGPNDRGLSARHLIRACEDSLQRLGTDWIDLYYLHLPDRDTPLEETLRAAEDLVRSGKVRYLGCSNYRAWEVVQLVETARQHGWQPIQAIQPLYNAANRDIEVEMLPMAEHYGLGVISYSPLARGVLTGKYRWDEPPPPDSRRARGDRRFHQAEWREASMPLAQWVVETAAELGVSAAQLATRWVIANELVHSALIGPRPLEQAREAVDSLAIPWTEVLEAGFDRLVPPGTHTGKNWPDPHYYPVRGRRSTGHEPMPPDRL